MVVATKVRLLRIALNQNVIVLWAQAVQDRGRACQGCVGGDAEESGGGGGGGLGGGDGGMKQSDGGHGARTENSGLAQHAISGRTLHAVEQHSLRGTKRFFFF